jgi:hypothetical protein
VRRAVALLALVPGMAMAEGERPPADYFTGVYERVGRTADAEPGLLDDLVRLAPDPQARGLVMTVCAPEGAPGTKPLLLLWDKFGDATNLLRADEGGVGLFCQYFNDVGNYPVIICGTGDAAGRYALWAVTDDRAVGCPG